MCCTCGAQTVDGLPPAWTSPADRWCTSMTWTSQPLRAGLPLLHPRLITWLAQGVAPGLPAVPQIEPFGPTHRAGNPRLDDLCRLLAGQDVHQFQAALGKSI